MKKQFLSFLLIILPILASAEAVKIDGIKYYLFADSKTAKVANGQSLDKSIEAIVIAAKVTFEGTEYVVNAIGDKAFKNCTYLTSVIIPNSVTTIGYQAFDHCKSLTSVNIPNSVTSIGEAAFESCYDLTSINIPNSVTQIEN